MTQNSPILLRHQQMMLAVRTEMGWPPYRPANDAIGFTSGRVLDAEVGAELARLAQAMRKDLIYSQWRDLKAADPAAFTIVYRQLHGVDIVDRVIPWAANDTAPIVFLSTRAEETYAVDARGSLTRIYGKPAKIPAGRKLAMKRIKTAAAAKGDELLANNAFLKPGQPWVEPVANVDTIVRFR